MTDPARYRTKEELEEYKKQDPIILIKSELLENNLITDDEFTKIDSDCIKKVNDAVEFADKSEEPPPEALYEDLYA